MHIIDHDQVLCNRRPAESLKGLLKLRREARRRRGGKMGRKTVLEVAQVYDLWNEYAVALHTGDLERWMSMWIDDGIRMAPGSPPQVGKEQIRAAMQSAFDHFNYGNMALNTGEVRILGDWGYSHGTYTFDMTPKEGGEATSYSGKFLDIVAKQADGSWKIAIDCHNFDEPRH